MHDDNLNPLETGRKGKGMYDLFESVDKRKERMVKLGLDPNNHVHIAAAAALRESEYLMQRGKKTVAKDYGKSLDEIIKQASKLSKAISELESSGYRNSFEKNFKLQINPGETIYCGLHGAERILHVLIKAIQSAKESAIDPIDNGYYIPFLFEFVNTLLIDTNFLSGEFDRYLALKKVKITKDGIKEFLITAWKEKYLEDVKETSKLIIEAKSGIEKESVEKVISRHLNRIVEGANMHKNRSLSICSHK